MTGKDGENCPAVCPAKCSNDEMHCWAGSDANDCPMADSCIPMKSDMLDINGYNCQNSCPPPHCKSDEIPCGKGYEMDGCMYNYPYCMSSTAGPGLNGQLCPNYCYEECSPDQISCYPGQDGNDCYMPNYCLPKVDDILGADGTPCYPTCPPPKCGTEKKLCPEGKGNNDCPTSAYCLAGKSNYMVGKDGENCENFCYPNCGSDEKKCWHGGEDGNGCRAEGYCVPETDGKKYNDS